jgi:hypothetical protein
VAGILVAVCCWPLVAGMVVVNDDLKFVRSTACELPVADHMRQMWASQSFRPPRDIGGTDVRSGDASLHGHRAHSNDRLRGDLARSLRALSASVRITIAVSSREACAVECPADPFYGNR